MANPIKVKIHGSGSKILQKLERFNPKGQPTLVAGVLGGSTRNEGKGQQSVATYAYWNEYGTETIPARPFMRNAVNAHLSEWTAHIANYLMQGATPREALETIKTLVRADIMASIKSDGFAPLSKKTIRRKERRGSNTPEKPLQDTQALLRSINAEIRDGNESS